MLPERMLCSSKPFSINTLLPLFLLLLLTIYTPTQAHSQANGFSRDHDDDSCTPAQVDPSPVKHLYAEDGMEVDDNISFSDLGQGWSDA